MSRRVELPDESRVLAARDELLVEATAHRSRATVLALARRLGLSNSTFWRHYPDIARELANASRRPLVDHPTTPPDDQRQAEGPADEIAALRREAKDMREQLELAATSIARLTLENHHLRRQLEDAAAISQLRHSTESPRTVSTH